jgi:hypothetical protein
MAERELNVSFLRAGEAGDVSVKRRCTGSDSSVRHHGAVRGDGGGEVVRDESRVESVNLGGVSEGRLATWGEHVHSAGVCNGGGSRGGMYVDSGSDLVALRPDGRGSGGAYGVPVLLLHLVLVVRWEGSTALE